MLQEYCEQNHDDTATVNDNAYMGEHFLIYFIHPQFRKHCSFTLMRTITTFSMW